MTNQKTSLVVGDHETLSAVADELEGRGDTVIRIDGTDAAGQDTKISEVVADGHLIGSLVLGFGTVPEAGSATRALAIIRASAPALIAGEARVVLISGRDYLGWPGRAESAIDLAGIVSLGRSLALEFGRQGVTVNVVCPPAELGAIEATEDPWEAPPPAPVGPVDSNDVAYAVGFLSQSASGYMTGQIVHVSGGLSVLSSHSA